MKRSIRKVLCIITALCVLLGTISVVGYALTPEEEMGYYESEVEEAIQFDPGAILPEKEQGSTSGTAKPFYSNGDANTAYRFYNQLTAKQKGLYDMFLSVGSDTNVYEVTVSDLTAYEGMGATLNAAVEASKALITADVVSAVTAVTEDNPLLFWFYGYGYSFSYYEGTYSNGNYYCRPATLKITITIDEHSYSDFADVQAKYNQLVTAVNEFKVNGISRYEKVKSIHDSICDMVTYPDVQGYFSNGSPFYGPMAHQPTGALLNGSAVCEGYAEAFKLICDREGIPCITVLGTGNGGGHKWNYVKLEDNKWYLLDATWDDQETSTYYSYFLIGSGSKTPYFGHSSQADSTVHIPDGQMYSSVDFALTYPTLSTETSCMSYLPINAGDYSFDNNRMCLLIGKGISSYSVYSGGNYSYTKTGSGVTGTAVTIKNGTATKTYTVAMRGDINDTDTVTTDDYNTLVKVASAKGTVTKNTAKFYAGDMTQDDVIDGFDAIALDLYIKGTLVFD